MRTVWVGLAALVFAAKEVPAQDAATLARAWTDTLSIDQRVLSEIERYAGEKNRRFEPRYAGEIAAGVRRLMVASLLGALEAPAEQLVEPEVTVSYMERGFARGSPRSTPSKSEMESEREFEESVIRTECRAFFRSDDVSPAEALDMYTDPGFRMGVTSRIKQISVEDGEDCVETEGVRILLDPTHYCSRIVELRDSCVAVQHSQVVSNRRGDGYQTVYFKESLKTFVKAPGGLIFHYVSYIRGGDLGAIQKKLARGKIADSERRAIEDFEDLLLSGARPSE